MQYKPVWLNALLTLHAIFAMISKTQSKAKKLWLTFSVLNSMGFFYKYFNFSTGI